MKLMICSCRKKFLDNLSWVEVLSGNSDVVDRGVKAVFINELAQFVVTVVTG